MIKKHTYNKINSVRYQCGFDIFWLKHILSFNTLSLIINMTLLLCVSFRIKLDNTAFWIDNLGTFRLCVHLSVICFFFFFYGMFLKIRTSKYDD